MENELVKVEVVENGVEYNYSRPDVIRLVRKSYRQILKDALIKSYAERGKHLIQHAVERAYEDDTVLIALIKKIVPEKVEVEGSWSLSKEDRNAIGERIVRMMGKKVVNG